MTIHEQVSEEIKLGNNTFLVEGCHRDWNPLPGCEEEVPEGTLWELRTEFTHHDGVERTIFGSGGTREEAIRELAFMVGVKTGADIIGKHLAD